MTSLLHAPLPDGGKKTIRWSGLFSAGLGLAIAETAARHEGVLVVVLDSARQLQTLETEIRFFLGQGGEAENGEPAVAVFPHWECLPYDNFSPHQDIISERLRILARLPEQSRGVLLTTCANLMQRLPPTGYVMGHSFALRAGERIDIEALRGRLQQAAYHAVNQVMSPGEYAVRGGLVDVFAMGAEQPFRLDLFDDEIDSIRYFDPETQRSTGKTRNIEFLPAREFPMTEEGIRQFRQAFRRRFEGDPAKQQVYSAVSRGNTPPGAEFFMPLFFERTATLFDYLPARSLLILDQAIDDTAGAYWAEVQDRFQNASFDPERRVLPPPDLYLDPEEFTARVDALPRIINSGADKALDSWRAPAAPPPELPVDNKSETPYQRLLHYLRDSGGRILLAAETPGRREALEGLLLDHDLLPTQVSGWRGFVDDADIRLGICVTPLERGLNLTAPALEIVTESQLYGERVFQRRRRSREALDPESVIRSLAELHVGDPVVHAEHGVGRYQGLQTLAIGDDRTEFLALEYQNGDKLYVPILSLHLIGRFVGGDAEHAPLHRLGSDQWQKAKRRAREKAYDVAAELLEMEALRNARSGHAFNLPAEEYAGFVARFPFEETPDQAQVIEDVLTDLQSAEPMDRLVCGDVGFGKTEVALRAAFVAVHDRKQVALLAPTTLLAQQHYQTFLDRFADLPVSIDLLSRFRSKKEATELVKRLGDGYPDILIGTHRLLQDDIRFKQLGLLIIDEEHRFGVRQKEKLKRLRSQVDILTLTATPIPRTLNLTMSGLRSISIIATPPQARLSIKTFVRSWNRGLIREACLREIRRGGQVYFLHNQV
ncbi:MAG: CarD family transcriptional regulator, partial [Pseudomonadota bacterium]|nr:CarD family transcriptional regulator [Pseudomonadota bacterium]